MWLLNQVMDHPLDEGYEDAAARRAAGEAPARTGARLWLIAGLVLIATVVSLGAATTRAAAPAVAQERAELIERVNSGTEGVERLQTDVDALRDFVAELRRAALQEEGGDQAELTALLAGAIAVTGPGVELVVDDAEGAGDTLGGGPRDGGGFADTGRLRDRDLQRIVNGLWEAGAEAVAVNGQRLTALSAIRAAGDAILVDNRPLVPPYTLHAVGDGEALRAAFELSGGGAALESLRDHYGIRASLAIRQDLRLPAASTLTLRRATPLLPEPAGQTGPPEPGQPDEEDTPDDLRRPGEEETP
jgi:uncharacterized protein YlxW (UPF0749 family)